MIYVNHVYHLPVAPSSIADDRANAEKSACDLSGSQNLFGNAIVFAITQPRRRGFQLCFAGDATELPGHRHSQTEFGNESFLSHAPDLEGDLAPLNDDIRDSRISYARRSSSAAEI